MQLFPAPKLLAQLQTYHSISILHYSPHDQSAVQGTIGVHVQNLVAIALVIIAQKTWIDEQSANYNMIIIIIKQSPEQNRNITENQLPVSKGVGNDLKSLLDSWHSYLHSFQLHTASAAASVSWPVTYNSICISQHSYLHSFQLHTASAAASVSWPVTYNSICISQHSYLHSFQLHTATMSKLHKSTVQQHVISAYRLVSVWLSCNALVSINTVTLHKARLVHGWVTILGRVNHLGAKPRN